jgi:FkbM family methyltransferase
MFVIVRGHTVDPSLFSTDPVILDLGANHGTFSQQMSERYGGTYYLIEANPVLASSLAAENRFKVWNYAVGATDGTVDLHLSANDESSSVLIPGSTRNPVLGEVSGLEKVTVKARSLSSLLAEIPSTRVDLIKMDIEGAEGAALLSLSPDSLQKIAQITVEFHCDEEFGFNLRPEVNRTVQHLRANGFLFLNFSGTTLKDVLFINRRLNHIPFWKGYLWEMAGTRPIWLRHVKSLVPENVRTRLSQAIDKATGRNR